VLGANKNKLQRESKRFRKREACFRTHFSLSSAKEIQGEREMVEPVGDCKCLS